MMYKKQTDSCFYMIYFYIFRWATETFEEQTEGTFQWLEKQFKALKMCYAANLDVSKHNGQKQTGLKKNVLKLKRLK